MLRYNYLCVFQVMLDELAGPPTMKFLETRIHITKVTMLYKITHNLVAINSDLYISPRTPHTRRSRSLVRSITKDTNT
jgi:hypothetical protein